MRQISYRCIPIQRKEGESVSQEAVDFYESHRWQVVLRRHWLALQEREAEPEPGLASGCCCCWMLGGRPCGMLDKSAASGTRSAGSWEVDRKGSRSVTSFRGKKRGVND